MYLHTAQRLFLDGWKEGCLPSAARIRSFSRGSRAWLPNHAFSWLPYIYTLSTMECDQVVRSLGFCVRAKVFWIFFFLTFLFFFLPRERCPTRGAHRIHLLRVSILSTEPSVHGMLSLQCSLGSWLRIKYFSH